MDEVGFTTAHVVGNSLGGWIAAELAVRGRARSVAAISPAGMFTRKELHYAVRALSASYEGAQRLAPQAEKVTATALGRRLAFGLVYARPERLSPDEAAYALRALAGSPSFPAHARMGRPGPYAEGLEQIDCPFRVIWGTHDLLLPRRQGPRWVRYVPGSRAARAAAAGARPDGRRPCQVAAAVLDLTAAGVTAGTAGGV